jgi:hypothetical protein
MSQTQEYRDKQTAKLNNTVIYLPTARQRLDKHIAAETESWQTTNCLIAPTTICSNEYTGNNRITSFAMQCIVNKTIEEGIFSMWFAYIYCRATDVSSVDPPRDCKYRRSCRSDSRDAT